MIAITQTRVRAADVVALTKPRIVLMVMLTAAAGFWMAGAVGSQTLTFFHLLLGTALVAAGSCAANQVLERDADALMRRTQSRPVPAGRLDVLTASFVAWTLGVLGVAYLAFLVNPLTSGIAAATLLSYAFVYTPLKRKTSLATLIGGIPGALPIVGGWTAATGSFGAGTWVLFWILFLWQLPHFLSLGWMYRVDYERAGFKMLSNGDPDGRVTFLNATLYAAALVPASLALSVVGVTGQLYFVGALVLSAWYFMSNVKALRARTMAAARRAFGASLLYLPILLLLMGLDRAI